MLRWAGKKWPMHVQAAKYKIRRASPIFSHIFSSLTFSPAHAFSFPPIIQLISPPLSFREFASGTILQTTRLEIYKFESYKIRASTICM